MSSPSLEKDQAPKAVREPVLQAKGVVKRYGPVTAIANSDLSSTPARSSPSSATTARARPA